MCGVIGVVAKENASQLAYYGLSMLQHRGQDAGGIMTFDEEGRFHREKGQGLLSETFTQDRMDRLIGPLAIGHVRYPTAGAANALDEAQPFYLNSPYGIAFAHNGNLVNTEELREDLYRNELRHCNTRSDSEVLHNLFSRLLRAQGGPTPTADKIGAALSQLAERVVGSYAVVAAIPHHGLIGFRDPWGIRPICYGKRVLEDGTSEYMIASESVALRALGFTVLGDIEPGQMVYITVDGQIHVQQFTPVREFSPCVFEYVYFARPDSVMNGVSVYEARCRMGHHLGKRFKQQLIDNEIDVIIPVPESSRPAALEMSHATGIDYREGFVKNRYVGRTFIMNQQKDRMSSVRRKLSVVDSEFRGKNVLLVDDSIVRGTTARQIVQMAREAMPNKIFFASAAPAVRHPNVYGIDMPSKEELVANNRTEDEVAEYLDVDGIFYPPLDDLRAAISECNPAIEQLDCSCFDGEYITGGVTTAYFDAVAGERNSQTA